MLWVIVRVQAPRAGDGTPTHSHTHTNSHTLTHTHTLSLSHTHTPDIEVQHTRRHAPHTRKHPLNRPTCKHARTAPRLIHRRNPPAPLHAIDGHGLAPGLVRLWPSGQRQSPEFGRATSMGRGGGSGAARRLHMNQLQGMSQVQGATWPPRPDFGSNVCAQDRTGRRVLAAGDQGLCTLASTCTPTGQKREKPDRKGPRH